MKISARWLLAIPAATYLLSYCYLAAYHQQLWLWHTVVHEGGTLRLWETTLYASHFLGHLPSLTVIAFIFAGSLLMLSSAHRRDAVGKLTLLLVALLAVSFLFSVAHFGMRETLEYMLQQRQSVARLEAGGSWLLHLPSTLLMFLFLPLFIFSARALLRMKIAPSRSGARLIASAFGLAILITLLACPDFFASLRIALTDPRYLAHGVREFATFPLTFFPLPLYLLLRNQPPGDVLLRRAHLSRLLICFLLCCAAFAYMTLVPLQVGVGELAQQPGFARGESLGIGYLLASHYFEHVLDTIYFTLACLLICRLAAK